MRKVLVVSYFYPPLPGVGPLRVSKMLKYMPENGYLPLVLAGGSFKDRRANVFYPSIPNPVPVAKWFRRWLRQSQGSLIKEIPKIQAQGWLPLSTVRMPDGYLYWVIPAVILGLSIIKRYKPDIIFSSSSPPSSAIVASILQLFTGLPWVAEFRDLWTYNAYDIRITAIENLDSFLEKFVIKQASSLVTVTEPLADILSRFHGKKVEVIYNGFDESDYPAMVRMDDKFSIAYTGTITPNKQDYRPLFSAVQTLKEQGLITPGNFKLKFYGPELTSLIIPDAARYDIQELCEVNDPIPNKECLKRQCESSLLLLLGWNNPRDKGLATGKLFEYLGTGRPILALGYPQCVMAEIIRTTNSGVLLNDPDQIADYIRQQLSEWQKISSTTRKVDQPEQIHQFSRRTAAQQMAAIFDAALKR
jgi:glycosyltransferase involved in cell wall biosynthesis